MPTTPDDAEPPRTFVPSPDGGDVRPREVERWLNERLGQSWSGYAATISRIPGVAVFARYGANRQGRLVLTGLLLLSDAITAEQVRKVPVGGLENSANLSMDDADDRMRDELERLPPLRRNGADPEEFSKLVAAHFNVWAKYVPHPAAAMAAEWNVKAPTVHTWIREARLRGFLPQAKRGKAS